MDAAQKIQKSSESPATASMVAKLWVINWKNRKKLVQPVTLKGYPKWPFYNVKMAEKVPNLRKGSKPI